MDSELDNVTEYKIRNVQDFIAKYGFPVDENNRITLTRGTYTVDSTDLSMGDYTLIASENITLRGFSQNVNKISSTKDGVALIEVTGADLNIVELQVSVSGTGARVMDMLGTGNEAMEIINCSFNSSTEWGRLDNIRQAFINGFFSVNSQRGFLITTAIGGFRMDNCRIINPVEYIARAAVGIPVGNVRVNTNSDLPSGCIAFQFDYDNFEDNSFLLKDGFYNGLGQVAKDFTTGDAVLAQNSRRSFFSNNQGNLAVNTSIGGSWSVTTEATTTIGAIATKYKLAGITTADKLVHFSLPSDNALTQESSQSRIYDVFGSVTLRATQNETVVLWIRKWDNSAGAYVDISKIEKLIQRLQGPRDIAEYVIFTEAQLDEDDRLELWVENLTSTNNVTMEEDSKFKVEKQ